MSTWWAVIAAAILGSVIGGAVTEAKVRETACAEACAPLDATRQDGRCRCVYSMEPRP